MKQDRSDRLKRRFKREAEKPTLYLYSGQRWEELHNAKRLACQPHARSSSLSSSSRQMTNLVTNNLYIKDFVAWADQQSMLLEQQRYTELDLANLVEEVKDLGNKHRDALESQLTKLLTHLLKWQFQSQKRTKSWRDTIKDARKQISRLIRKHPVLSVHVEAALAECYMDARVDAADETELIIDTFPLMCPYNLKTEILNSDFFPGERLNSSD